MYSLATILVTALALNGVNGLGPLEARNSKAGFGYTAKDGPLVWHKLDPEANTLCKTGKHQSPINVDSTIPIINEKPIIHPGSLKGAKYLNLGTTLEVELEGETSYHNKTWHMKQFHLHAPSEHHIHGQHFPLEMHIVHQADDKSLLVLSQLFQLVAPYGKHHPRSRGGNKSPQLLSVLAEATSEIPHAGDETYLTHAYASMDAVVDAMEKGDLVGYSGSLTTPPCSEGVTWVVNTTPMEVDVESYEVLRKVLGYNARIVMGTGEEALEGMVCGH